MTKETHRRNLFGLDFQSVKRLSQCGNMAKNIRYYKMNREPRDHIFNLRHETKINIEVWPDYELTKASHSEVCPPEASACKGSMTLPNQRC